MSKWPVHVLDRPTKIAHLRRYLISLAAVGPLLVGCKGGIDEVLEQTIEQQYELAPNGSLSIRNEDGSIRLYGSNSREVHLEAIKKAYSARRLNGIKVQASAHAASISIETIFPPKKKWSLNDRSGTVDYIVIVPQDATISSLQLVNGEISIDGLRGGNAKARLANGRISACDCFTNLDYEVGSGAIDFFYNWWEKQTFRAKATILSGPATVFLPRSASLRIAAETLNGQVMSNLLPENQNSYDGSKKVNTIIGSDPGPTFQIEVKNGNIRIEGY